MKYYLCLIGVLLSACSERPLYMQASPAINAVPTAEDRNISVREVSYYDEPLTNSVNDYAKWLIQDLFANIDVLDTNEVFMVADLSVLDSEVNRTNLFGRQMSEAILHEVHQTGFSAVDVKSTGFIRVSEKGEVFAESNDYTELKSSLIGTSVITGTLTRYRGGYLINSRAVRLSDNLLIASAQIFVPSEIADSVMTEDLDLSKSYGSVKQSDQMADNWNNKDNNNTNSSQSRGIELKKFRSKNND